MHEEQKTVFISYRRKVASFIARAVFQDLHANSYDVFMDVESIDAGQFEQIIFNQIEARAHFLIVLTPGTIERYSNPNDMMRREIEFALEKKRNIVPLLVNDFKFNKRTNQYFTDKLLSIPTLNGLSLPHDYFDAAMERLRTRFLKQPIYGTIKIAPVSEQAAVQRTIAEAAAQPAPTKKQLSAEDYFSRAYKEADSGDRDAAIADYTEAIRINPQYADAYNNLGNVRQAKGDNDGAIADYTEAIRLNPQFAFAYNNRGLAYKAKGDNDAAIADYTEAIRLDPQYASAYNSRGLAYGNKGDHDRAIADYDNAIRLDAKFFRPYGNRGDERQAKSDFKGAIDDYQKYLDLGGGRENNNQSRVEEMIRDLQAELKSK